MTCKTCGEVYPKGMKKVFVNYCCKEQAWQHLEAPLSSLKTNLVDYLSARELDDFLQANGIQRITEP